jgi:hypothetical protein
MKEDRRIFRQNDGFRAYSENYAQCGEVQPIEQHNARALLKDKYEHHSTPPRYPPASARRT